MWLRLRTFFLDEGAVAVEGVDGGVTKDIRMVVRHVAGDGEKIREKKPRLGGLSMTKNAAPMCEMRKDPEYRRRENECRKEKRIAEYKKEKEQKPGRSILSPYADEMEENSGIATKAYRIHKNLKLVQVITLTFQ